jgi:hypothetical protein
VGWAHNHCERQSFGRVHRGLLLVAVIVVVSVVISVVVATRRTRVADLIDKVFGVEFQQGDSFGRELPTLSFSLVPAIAVSILYLAYDEFQDVDRRALVASVRAARAAFSLAIQTDADSPVLDPTQLNRLFFEGDNRL